MTRGPILTPDRTPDACFWSDRCYWVRDPDGYEVLIPMCMGAAIHPSGCTCRAPKSAIERAEARADIARAKVIRLREKLLVAGDRLNGFFAENRALRIRLQAAEK